MRIMDGAVSLFYHRPADRRVRQQVVRAPTRRRSVFGRGVVYPAPRRRGVAFSVQSVSDYPTENLRAGSFVCHSRDALKTCRAAVCRGGTVPRLL
jgi:hypothetical protein